MNQPQFETAAEAGKRWHRHPSYFLKLGRVGILLTFKKRPVLFDSAQIDEVMILTAEAESAKRKKATQFG